MAMAKSVSSRLLVVLVVVSAVFSSAQAAFHVMNIHNVKTGSQAIQLVPSDEFSCVGVNHNHAIIADQMQYPDCSAAKLSIPDGQCGWRGVSIKPSCGGNYFGKLYGASGEPQGDCYWSDGHDTPSFTCNEYWMYDRLVCFAPMCGGNAAALDEIN